MRLYKARFPDEVAGMVLIDPSAEEIYARFAALGRSWLGKSIADIVNRYEACGVRENEPHSDLYCDCSDWVHAPLGSEINAQATSSKTMRPTSRRGPPSIRICIARVQPNSNWKMRHTKPCRLSF